MQVALPRKLLTMSRLGHFPACHDGCLERDISGTGTSQPQPVISKTRLFNKFPGGLWFPPSLKGCRILSTGSQDGLGKLCPMIQVTQHSHWNPVVFLPYLGDSAVPAYIRHFESSAVSSTKLGWPLGRVTC